MNILRSLFLLFLSVAAFQSQAQPGVRGARSWKSHSVLASGTWYKMGISESGVYKLSFEYLQKLGIKLDQIDATTFQIFGQGGGPLPEWNQVTRVDDLMECAIEVVDGGDGRIDAGDYLLFYARGPHQWIPDSVNKTFRHQLHPYDNSAYYFLTYGIQKGKRISSNSPVTQNPDYITNTSDCWTFHEEDKINLIKTGREWFGEEFDKVLTYTFTSSLPDLDLSQPVTFRSEFAGRSFTGCSYTASVNGTMRVNLAIPPVGNALESYYVYPPVVQESTFQTGSSDFNIQFQFSRASDNAIGWLNYYELIGRRKLNFTSGQFGFRDIRSLGAGKVVEFDFSGTGNAKVWDVTQPNAVTAIPIQSNGSGFFIRSDASMLHEYVIHNGGYMEPQRTFQIGNQDLHGTDNYAMVILTHPDYLEQANALKQFHEGYNNFSVLVMTPEKIFNEYSSGAQDPTAIKDFMKMMFDRSDSTHVAPRFLLLVGDASYDYKDRLANNTNRVPTYETENSFSPIGSFVSDDYYAYLGDDEGDYSGTEDMDISIGRLPVSNTTEANDAVQKIMNYVKPSGFGSWRNQLCFIADDKDGNQHLSQTESLFTLSSTADSVLNMNKIYFDSFKRTIQNGSFAYPDVNAHIRQQMRDGALVITYAGHGGETGWAHEHVLGMDDINGWKNKNRLPLFVTATCEFTKFDDPSIESGGERVFLNPHGGGIALITTSRLVFGSGNQVLTENLFRNNLFSGNNTATKTLGECYRDAKNLTNDMNSQRFVLIGDPALYLSLPSFSVKTTTMNGRPVTQGLDTIKALSFNQFEGEVWDKNNQLASNFTGEVEVTVYDKPVIYKTLGNDPESVVVPFQMQNSIIYKGVSSVKDGKFTFSFYTPKDIAYPFGFGKISYYAQSATTDASGVFSRVVVGGSENPTKIPTDGNGPSVRLFMNDTLFISGGVTNENPTLLALIADEHGINTVASGIGHDITALLDNNQEQLLVLNDFFQSEIDQSARGKIVYPFSNLTEGSHHLTLKVWDVFNNSAEASIDFVVVKGNKPDILTITNFPNPFTEKTTFAVQHNQFGNNIDLWFEITDVTGRTIFVKHFESMQDSNSFTWDWDGSKENGDQTEAGIYFYRFLLRAGNQEEVKSGKLIRY